VLDANLGKKSDIFMLVCYKYFLLIVIFIDTDHIFYKLRKLGDYIMSIKTSSIESVFLRHIKRIKSLQ